MRWAAGVSDVPEAEAAFEQAAEGVRRGLGGAAPDLVLLFVSRHHGADEERILETAREAWPRALLLGCSAQSVIGAGREIEHRPGLSLTAARLPGVEVRPVRLGEDAASDPDPNAWDEAAPGAARPAHLVLLADPFTCDAEALLSLLDARLPGSVKIGALASGGTRAGENALYLGDALYRGGLVGVALGGALELDAIVAQGCRPVAQPMFVTRCRDGRVCELDGRPAVEALRGVYEGLPPADQELARSSLFLGIEMQSSRSEYGPGDFLIRNLVGLDTEGGALAVGAHLRVGQVVQFHLRDGRASAQDLERHLTRYAAVRHGSRPGGALMFSCLGRGRHLYGCPDHDTELFRRRVGDVPIGGFFGNGEIGPVEGRTFLHGYTSAIGIFRPRR